MSDTSTNRKGYGIVKVTHDGVRIITGYDIIRYYQWLINRATWDTVKNQLPRFGAHITIVNRKIHNFSFKEALEFNNLELEFDYFPEDIHQSRVNFWMPVKCEKALQIKKELKVTDKDFWGLHLTICNTKFNLTGEKK